MNFKESKEGYMGGLGRSKGNEESDVIIISKGK